MPHSPRWYRGKLWLLESGEGSLAQGRSGAPDLADRRAASRFHARHRLCRTAGFHRPLAGARERGLQRHSAGRARCASAPVACGWSTSRPARRLASCASKPACKKSSRCRVLRGMRFPELLEWNDAAARQLLRAAGRSAGGRGHWPPRRWKSRKLPNNRILEILNPKQIQMNQSTNFKTSSLIKLRKDKR